MDNTIYDCIIIGAGPAGLTSAIYLLRAGKKVLILEKSAIGGGIASTPMIENYPGCAKISGEQLADNLFAQVTDFGGELEVWEVKKIEEDGDHYKLVTDGPDFFAKTIIIATGTTWRRLGLPNEENLIGHGISFCVTCDGAFYKDQTVAIIGGGNTAVTNALELSDICKKLIVVQNLADLTGENILNEKLKAKENVEIIYNATVKELIGEDELKGIVIN
ncbi:MAG: FAD-dependent oxidoreductase, partial [Lachnospiraceae bacterium]|nr:FAD-dependent oxidoreductase [Lachnospiraceae bacterium]